MFAGCVPTTVGFPLCQGEIVSINRIIYWESLGPPRASFFFPVRTSPVRTSHSHVICLSLPSSRLQQVVRGKFPESSGYRGSCFCRTVQRTGVTRSMCDQEGRLGKEQLGSAHQGEESKGAPSSRPSTFTVPVPGSQFTNKV